MDAQSVGQEVPVTQAPTPFTHTHIGAIIAALDRMGYDPEQAFTWLDNTEDICRAVRTALKKLGIRPGSQTALAQVEELLFEIRRHDDVKINEDDQEEVG